MISGPSGCGDAAPEEEGEVKAALVHQLHCASLSVLTIRAMSSKISGNADGSVISRMITRGSTMSETTYRIRM